MSNKLHTVLKSLYGDKHWQVGIYEGDKDHYWDIGTYLPHKGDFELEHLVGSKFSAVIANLPLNFVPKTNVLQFDACREHDGGHSSNEFKERLKGHGYTGIIAVHTGLWLHGDFGKMG